MIVSFKLQGIYCQMKNKKNTFKRRNPFAKALELPEFQPKIKKDKKKFDRAKRRDYFRDSLE